MKPVVLLLFAALILPMAAEAPRKKVVAAYVPNWIDLKAYAPKIDYARLTHINVAFENPADDAGNLSFHSSDRLILEEAKKHGVKVLVSIGGGSAADDPVMQPRYKALMAEDKRHDFAVKLAAFVTEHGFDGLDVDIEGPSITPDYGPFIEECSTALKPKGKLLTAALSRGYGGDQVPDSALKCYDLLHIMAYDATGPWSLDRPGQHSSLEFATACADYWLGRGVPKERAVLGLPFYGYGFGDAVEKRGYAYKEIVTTFPGSERNDQAGETVWFNGIPTIQAKSRMVSNKGLAGVMIWSLNQDAEGDLSLLKAASDVLNPPVKKPEKHK